MVAIVLDIFQYKESSKSPAVGIFYWESPISNLTYYIRRDHCLKRQSSRWGWASDNSRDLLVSVLSLEQILSLSGLLISSCLCPPSNKMTALQHLVTTPLQKFIKSCHRIPKTSLQTVYHETFWNTDLNTDHVDLRKAAAPFLLRRDLPLVSNEQSRAGHT